MRNLCLLVFLFALLAAKGQDFDYHVVDSTKQKWGDWDNPEWLRYFGLDAGDVDNDGLLDLISGRYVYHQPHKSLTSGWKRTVLDDNVDGIFILDIDGDPFADIIAQALPDIFWYEAINSSGTRYERKKIAQVPATSHVNSQGFEKAQIIPGGPQELLIAGNGNVYLLIYNTKGREKGHWTTHLIGENTSDEGIGVGDIDGDGDIDFACGRRLEGEEEPRELVWFENTGTFNSPWQSRKVGLTQHAIDRVRIGDLDNDGHMEIVVSEERYPGLEPDSHVIWFSRPSITSNTWTAHPVTTQYSSNNLELVDMNLDGLLDILTAEHKGPELELQLWENQGEGSFAKRVLDTGKENHLGAKVFDLDSDGDLDILGAGWDNYRFVHLWENNQLSANKGKENGLSPISASSRTLSDSLIVSYQNKDHFVIKTAAITYYYDVAGGGFSRMIDRHGNDWISFKQSSSDYPQGAAGIFRGIPNLVYQGEDNGAGHPGFDQCRSWFENGKLYSESKSGKWKWSWTFFDHHAEIEILRSDPNRNYWFLYEGTPGGSYANREHYFGTTDQGPTSELPDFYKGESLFEPLSMVYAGAHGVESVFFMISHAKNPTQGIIGYLGNSTDGIQSENGMTVFGFGRSPSTQPLLNGPARFTIGIYEKEISSEREHERFMTYLKKNHLK